MQRRESERKRKKFSRLEIVKSEKEGSLTYFVNRVTFSLFFFFAPTFLFLDSPFATTDHIGTVNVCLETRSWQRRECECFCDCVGVCVCVVWERVRVRDREIASVCVKERERERERAKKNLPTFIIEYLTQRSQVAWWTISKYIEWVKKGMCFHRNRETKKPFSDFGKYYLHLAWKAYFISPYKCTKNAKISDILCNINEITNPSYNE